VIFGVLENARDHPALLGHAHAAFSAKLLKGFGYLSHGCLLVIPAEKGTTEERAS
jgi:hypothetical protein